MCFLKLKLKTKERPKSLEPGRFLSLTAALTLSLSRFPGMLHIPQQLDKRQIRPEKSRHIVGVSKIETLNCEYYVGK